MLYDGKLTIGYGASGGIAIGSASFGGVTYNGISNPTGVTTLPTLVVKGLASQTANLQQWQDSTGAVKAFIRSDGYMYSYQGFGGTIDAGQWIGGAVLTAKPYIASQVAEIIRGVTSQTADLTQWQNSAGTVLANVDANGKIAAPIFQSTVAGTAYIVTGSNNNAIRVQTNGTTNVGLIIRGETSQTANLQEWQNSSGTVMGRVDGQYGTIRSISGLDLTNTYTGAPTITARVNYPNTTPIIIVGAASQTANLQEWQNSAGTVLAKVDANGQGTFNALTLTSGNGTFTSPGWSGFGTFGPSGGTSGVTLGISPYIGTNTALVVRGFTSQSANLQEWQNSSGTVLTKINSNGALSLSNATLVTSESSNVGDKIGLYSNVFGFGIDYGRTVAFVSAVGDAFAVRVAASSGTASFGSDAVALFGNGSVVQTLSSASTVGLIIKGAASQTANLFEIQDSSGNALVSLLATANSTNTLRFTDNFAFGINWGSRKFLAPTVAV